MQSIPVQSWTFEQEPIIRIGRSTDNHVILYSAVVSRHHVEIRKVESGWEIVNLGANGTYVDGKRITQVPVEDGVVIRLARSGPNVQIHVGVHSTEIARSLLGEKTVGQRVRQASSVPSIGQTDIPELEAPAIAATPIPSTMEYGDDEHQEPDVQTSTINPGHLHTTVEVDEWTPPPATSNGLILSSCCYQYLESEYLFCLQCGKPLRPLGEVGNYQILKTLEQDDVSLTQLAWSHERTVVLMSLLPDWMGYPEVANQFAQEAQRFATLSHPGLPKYLDSFVLAGQPYLTLEPVYGRSLDQIVATEGALSPQATLTCLLDVCAALDYLHSQTPPILHQTLSPDRLLHSTTQVVGTGLTPARSNVPVIASDYSAPEQVQGQRAIASDLYALGPILVYLLTGESPKPFYTQREQGLRFYAEYVPGLPPDLVPVIRKLTNPNLEERFASAAAVTAALQQALAGK